LRGACLRTKTVNYRRSPTKAPQRLLSSQLQVCRWLENTLLAARRAQAGVGRAEAAGRLGCPAARPARRERNQAPHAPLQELPAPLVSLVPLVPLVPDVARRLHPAGDACFRRLHAGVGRDARRTFPSADAGGRCVGCRGEAAGRRGWGPPQSPRAPPARRPPADGPQPPQCAPPGGS
jgi:hypothetical protein